MWTKHQRPTHEHARPIYNPAHGVRFAQALREATSTVTKIIEKVDNCWKADEKTLCQMA